MWLCSSAETSDGGGVSQGTRQWEPQSPSVPGPPLNRANSGQGASLRCTAPASLHTHTGNVTTPEYHHEGPFHAQNSISLSPRTSEPLCWVRPKGPLAQLPALLTAAHLALQGAQEARHLHPIATPCTRHSEVAASAIRRLPHPAGPVTCDVDFQKYV